MLNKKFPNNDYLNMNLYSNKSIDKTTSQINDKLDAIILNASDTLFVPKDKYRVLTPDLFKKYVNINLISQYRIIYNLIPKLKSNSNIVLISSVTSKNGIGNNIAYSSSCTK